MYLTTRERDYICHASDAACKNFTVNNCAEIFTNVLPLLFACLPALRRPLLLAVSGSRLVCNIASEVTGKTVSGRAHTFRGEKDLSSEQKRFNRFDLCLSVAACAAFVFNAPQAFLISGAQNLAHSTRGLVQHIRSDQFRLTGAEFQMRVLSVARDAFYFLGLFNGYYLGVALTVTCAQALLQAYHKPTYAAAYNTFLMGLLMAPRSRIIS